MKSEKRITRVFFALLCVLATVVILTPQTPLERQLQTRVIYIHKPAGQDSQGATTTGATQGKVAAGEAKGGGGTNVSGQDGSGSADDSVDENAKDDYKTCPRMSSVQRPSLEGMPLDFSQGRRGFSVNDSFIHKGNYEQLLHGEYTLHRHTIPELPDSYDDITRNFKFNSCAVVGSSGYLKLAQFGQAIDTHDVVVRLNQSPVKAYARWVGTKTTMRILNSLWSAHYGSGRYEGMQLPLEKNLTIVVTRTTGHAFDKIVETMKKVSVIFSLSTHKHTHSLSHTHTQPSKQPLSNRH